MKYISCGVVMAILLAGCGSPHEPDLIVFAAASLKKAFTELGERYETENPGLDVEFVFAGSADLLTQLVGGAEADVLATADTATMDRASEAGLLFSAPVNFATNTLTIVVAPGNPMRINSFQDLTRPGLALVTCAPQVPCGAATGKVEKATAVTLSPVSEESQVSDVLTKVISGQADAGLVYVTDALAAGRAVTAVPFPEAAGAVNTYPIAVLQQSTNLEPAQGFVALVTGETGRQILAAAGFARP